MSEPTTEGAASAQTAGALLRAARQAQGMHIAALAAAIKVSPRKLEALEGDRYDELPDTTFTRALAQTVCRALKIDAEPVLARLPQAPGKGLDQVSPGLNAPFRERGLRSEGRDWSALNKPALWAAVALVLAAAVVYFAPAGLLAPRSSERAAPASAASAASAASSGIDAVQASAPVILAPAPEPASAALPSAPAASAPASKPAGVAAAAGSTAAAPTLAVQTSAPSWVEVRDASGRALVSRLVNAGESLEFDGEPPFKVKIGNAAATRLSFRGQPVALGNVGRDNVARLELK